MDRQAGAREAPCTTRVVAVVWEQDSSSCSARVGRELQPVKWRRELSWWLEKKGNLVGYESVLLEAHLSLPHRRPLFHSAYDISTPNRRAKRPASVHAKFPVAAARPRSDQRMIRDDWIIAINPRASLPLTRSKSCATLASAHSAGTASPPVRAIASLMPTMH